MGEHKRKGRYMIPMKRIEPSARHKACRDAMIDSVRKEMADMDASEVLAVAAYTVGQLIALQDHRKMTPAMALKIVSDNIEAGNEQAQAEVRSASGSAN